MKCENVEMRECENVGMRECENVGMREWENGRMGECENGIFHLGIVAFRHSFYFRAELLPAYGHFENIREK